MHMSFYLVLICFNLFCGQNLFDHATKQYTDYLANQSPEKAKIAQTIIQAAKLIKEVEQSTEKKTEKEGLIDHKDVEIDEKTFDELRLICAKKGSPLLEKVGPKTSVGFAHLIKILTQPTTDTEELKKQQKIVAFFIEHPDVIEKIRQLLIDLKKEEDLILIPYKNYTVKNKAQVIGMFSFLFCLETLLIYSALNFGFFDYKAQIDACLELTFKDTNRDNIKTMIKEFFKFENTQTLFQFVKKTDLTTRINIGSVSFTPLCFLAAYIYSTSKTIFSVKNFVLSNPLITYAIDLFTLSDRIKNQNSFFKMVELLKKVQPSIPHTFSSLNENKPSLEKITDLNTSTHSHARYCIDTDGMLISPSRSFYAEEKISSELNPHTDFLKKLYYDVGLLDAYTSLAQLYKNQKCHFAQYVDSALPALEINNGLHPNGLGYQNLIGNDFLHKPINGARPIVVSGKNGSGKSFNTKMIIQNALLAQTLTFTFTDNPCVITPFDYFKIHANISDSDYYSKFETEKNEITQLLEKIFTLQQKNKKGFIIFDEPFSTTSSVLAEPLINTLIAMLQKNNGFLPFIITHLHATLSHPETRQMSIKVIPNGDGTFTSTRKFQEGPSFDNDAAQLLAQNLNPLLRDIFLKAYETEMAKIGAKKYKPLNHNHTQEPEKKAGTVDKD